MDATPTAERFAAALDTLVADLRQDRSVLAAILCGSLSHDRVWEKSDVDLLLVTIDDRKVTQSHAALYADGVNVHAMLMPRAEFRKMLDGATHHSFMHSYVAKGRVLYTHDESIADMVARLSGIGAADTATQRIRAGMMALAPLYKARKWLTTRGDLQYASLWILYAATGIAQLEVLAHGRPIDREVIPQAATLNPALFATIYADLLNAPKSRAGVEAALETAERYLHDRAIDIFRPVLDYLRACGDVRSCLEINDHFERHAGVTDVTAVCEYLSDQGLIGKAAAPLRLTLKSTAEVQELAFYAIDGPRA